ncbi:dephospho-CoA kinase [Methylocucumis oryzae]|uniref:Dephospho-CoA kinase n=1 Tax=Methylocucumis oryzae TaxID=1632867 RepID=A0A0F3IN26_9GAMM|nr:dephospho-CoA kinase [Methylocucumis oryzae]KJV06959.1 dephospho-CoA kinase [Methylocucumis oryzae]
MLKIGLTGGIGCGKSTVAQLFLDLGTPVIDADEIAKRLVVPGQPALQQIQRVFGDNILTEDGWLNRAALRSLIFTQPMLKQQLEAILHPLIYQTIATEAEALAKQCTSYSIICLPLLFETKAVASVDRVLVVDCTLEQQINRVMARDKQHKVDVERIIASQVSRNYRLSHADDVIDNSNTDDSLAERVKKLHNLYLSISKSRN